MFKDHFSKKSSLYKEARPTYPKALFEYLALLTKAHDLAWDCATGNGQAAVMLANYYKKVVATDASEEQIKQAVSKCNIDYRVSLAENSGLLDKTADLITVAQAFHWFCFEDFFKETKRVLKQNGFLAIWCYELLTTASPNLNQLIGTFYQDIVGPYWPKERRHIENRYQDIQFPFEKLETPEFFIEPNWTLQELLNYFSSWSSTQYYQKDLNKDPIESWLKPRLLQHGSLDEKFKITIPIYLLVGKSF